MSRSKWKIKMPALPEEFISESFKSDQRAFVIPDKWIGSTLQIYQGQNWVRVRVSAEMVGKLLGEFARTRRIGTHKKKKIR